MKIYENAEEHAKDCDPQELLENYLSQRDMRDYSDAQAFLDEARERGLEISVGFGQATIRDKR